MIQLRDKLEKGKSTLQALNELLLHFRRPAPKPRKGQPPPMDRQQTLRRCHNQINKAMQMGQLHRAYEALVEARDGRGPDVLRGDEHPELIEQYFPKATPINFPIRELQQAWSPITPPTEQEIEELIRGMPRAKAPGPSGITAEHLKYLSRKWGFAKILKNAFKQLLDSPEKTGLIPSLYEFFLIFIPKSKGGYRPICIEEATL